MEFVFREGWYCEFLEEDLKTKLPRRVFLKDEKSVMEMAERGGLRGNPSVKLKLGDLIRKKRGGIWLELTAEQHAKLKRT
jgi:hypothetical protein